MQAARSSIDTARPCVSGSALVHRPTLRPGCRASVPAQGRSSARTLALNADANPAIVAETAAEMAASWTSERPSGDADLPYPAPKGRDQQDGCRNSSKSERNEAAHRRKPRSLKTITCSASNGKARINFDGWRRGVVGQVVVISLCNKPPQIASAPVICSNSHDSRVELRGWYLAGTVLPGVSRARCGVCTCPRRICAPTAARQLAKHLSLRSPADQTGVAGRPEQGISQESTAAG
jgi:hypothetical protein